MLLYLHAYHSRNAINLMLNKPLTLLTLSAFLFVNTTIAQDLNGKFFLDGNFSFSTLKSSVAYGIGDAVESKNMLGLAPGIGFMISEHVGIGIGLTFQQSRSFDNHQSLPGIPGSPGQVSELLSKEIAPHLFLKYLHPLSDRTYAGAGLKLLYGLEGSKVLSIAGSISLADSSSFTYGTRYYGLAISPELQFMLTKTLGIKANFDLFSLKLSKQAYFGNDNTILSSDFNLNPSNWTLGLVAYFGRP